MSPSLLTISSLVLIVLLALCLSFLFGEHTGRAGEEAARRAAGESAEQQAKRIISNAVNAAELIRVEAIRVGDAEIARLRAALIEKSNERRDELTARELRVRERESVAEARVESVVGRERAADRRESELRRRAPERPLGPLTMQKLVERVMPSWHSPNDLTEIAFELTLRPTGRAAELLEVVRVRLQALGVTLPRTNSDRHSEIHADSRTKAVEFELSRLGARLQALEREKEAAESENRTLSRELIRLKQERTHTRQRESDMLDKYFIRTDAPKDLLEWARKFWRNRLHPDGDAAGAADLTRKYQEMERAFTRAIDSVETA